MTLPASYPLSILDIANELSLSFPLSLNHPWIIALAGKSALPVSFSDLLGKSGHFAGNVSGSGAGSTLSNSFNYAPFFGGTLDNLIQQGSSLTLSFGSAPNWNGNVVIAVPNESISIVFSRSGYYTWVGTGNIVPPNGQTVYMTVYPHQ